MEVTLVTSFRRLDPRRSLVAAISWLVIALAACFAIGASLWVGSLARANIVQQHARRLALETDQLASDLAQAIGARRNAVAATAALASGAGAAAVFAALQRDYPQLGWIGMTDQDGRPVAGAVAGQVPQWMAAGRRGLWLGVPAEDGGALFEPLRPPGLR